MFFKKKPKSEPKLTDVVKKTIDTGYIFWNINDDLGHFAKEIMESTPTIIMAYAYARRSAAAALYIQGLCDKDAFNHVESIFKALQQQTGHTVEFQEQAAAKCSEFLQSYNYAITMLFTKKALQIAREYEIPGHRLSDAELFAKVIETVHQEKKQMNDYAQGVIASQLHGLFGQTFENVRAKAVRPNSTYTEEVNSIVSKLREISNRKTKKSFTRWIQPLGEREHWSCEVHYSDEEEAAVNELLEELFSELKGKVTMTPFAYREPSN